MTYNIRKGLHPWKKRCLMVPLARRVKEFEPDLVLLQEFPGEHRGRFDEQSSFEKINSGRWGFQAYARSLRTRVGHHGNAILSRYPIVKWESFDLSASLLDRRSLVAAKVQIGNQEVWVLNVHLGLLGRWRASQLSLLSERIASISAQTPVILGGDFNDWDLKLHESLRGRGWIEAHEHARGDLAQTFPSQFPVLKLDRIYVRGCEVLDAQVISETSEEQKGWDALSDHLALMTSLKWNACQAEGESAGWDANEEA